MNTNVEDVFGADSRGLLPEEAARNFPLKFVRGERALGLFDIASNPTGHILTAWEAYHAYGLSILEEAIEYGSAILAQQTPIATTIGERIEILGLKPSAVANESRLSKEVVDKAVSPRSQNNVGDLEHIAFTLGLDELQLGYQSIPHENELAVRLRTLQRQATADMPRLSPRAVLTFAHAASVIRTQGRLQDWLGERPVLPDELAPDDYYGTTLSPAYGVGYELAAQARQALGLGDRPIPSMRDLVEKELGIPVIQTELPRNIAGATLAVNSEQGEVRGIVLNTEGANENVWVRRATLAHELGHLLFDPVQKLDLVRVDTYQSTAVDPQQDMTDRVEQRANAFAIAFLAPVDAVREMVPAPIQASSMRDIQSIFGISYTAARNHIQNAHYRAYELPRECPRSAPSDEQVAAENFTTDYFPLQETPHERVGRFAGIVLSSFDGGYISADSAAKYLGCSKDTLFDNLDDLRSLYSSE